MPNIDINNRTKTFMTIRSQLSNMTDKQISKQLQKISDRANRQIATLENHPEVYSPAYQAMVKARGESNLRFNPNPGNLNKKRRELRQALDFLEDDTSTLAGSRRYKQQVKETLGISDKRLSDKALSNIWYLINRAKETNPVITDYKPIAQELYDYVKDYDFRFSDYDELEEEDQDEIDNATNKVVDMLEDMNEKVVDAWNKGINGGSKFNM